VRLLLDTHTFLWFIGGDAALSPYARQLIEDRTNERLLSIASLWEMAIKVSLGRLTGSAPVHGPGGGACVWECDSALRDSAQPFGCTDHVAFLS
jgi:hypothetical protein